MLFTDTEVTISDHQQSWGYEDGPWKGPRPARKILSKTYTGRSLYVHFLPPLAGYSDFEFMSTEQRQVSRANFRHVHACA